MMFSGQGSESITLTELTVMSWLNSWSKVAMVVAVASW